MDPAVALVQAFLEINGYLTTAEFPIVAAGPDGWIETTDVDLIAIRFPGARSLGGAFDSGVTPDERLQLDSETLDVVLAEVKEGRAHLNLGLRREDTLRTVLQRVGCCEPNSIDRHVTHLIERGITNMEHRGTRCRARIALFAGRPGSRAGAGLFIPLSHVALAVERFVRKHTAHLRSLRWTQPALAHYALTAKLLGTRSGSA